MTADNRDANESNGYRILPGWRVGRLREESATRSGLLVPAGTESTTDALALVDIVTGLRFWAVPTGAWRFLWPDSGRVAVAVRESRSSPKSGTAPRPMRNPICRGRSRTAPAGAR